MKNGATESEARRGISRLRVWARAVRAFSFTASVLPVMLGLVLAVARGREVSWRLFPLVIICALLYHAGTNVVSEYFDFRRGVDRKDTFGSSRVLVDGLLSPRKVLAGGLAMFGVGSALGLVLVAVRGLPILILGVVGLLGGYLYAGAPVGYKYLGIGDAMVFLLMGPLMVIGSHLALTGVYEHDVLLASLPIGFLVAAILHSNNLRDLVPDARANVKTLAGLIGPHAAKVGYHALVSAAYGSVVAMILAGEAPIASLAVFLSVPLAVRNMRAVAQSVAEEPRTLASIDVQTAQLHLVFGLLYVGSFLTEALSK